MKITILQGAFLPIPAKLGGAVEKMWFALGIDFAKRGHDVIHISRKYENLPTEEIIENVWHRRVLGYSTPSSILLLKFLDLIYTLRAIRKIPLDTDIIITNTFWAPILLPKKIKKKCIVDVQRMPKKQLKFYHGTARLRANSSSVSAAIEKVISIKYHKNILLIPNPLPFNNTPKIYFPDKEKLILYVGRIHPEKGLDILINAFKESNDDWILQIVGPSDVQTGGGGKAYLNHLKKISEDSRVIFTDPVFDIKELNLIYKKASVFVYPSVAEYGETFGVAPLEAMAWGCVPIVSNLACFKDFIDHGRNGLIFNHRRYDASGLLSKLLFQLKNNSIYRNEMAFEAIKVRHSHSLNSISTKFLEEFEQIIYEQRS